MSNELTVAQQNQMLAQLSQKAMLPSGMNVGSVAIEQERAIAEARGQMQLAKMFPRDLTRAHSELMAACKSKSFAAAAFYSVPRGGGAVSGPSIRLAEEIARVVGNFQYGHRELSRDDHKSEVEVFAWDVENNNRSTRQLTVMHVIDTKNGPKACRDQKEIDDKISNVASKQVRGRILALVPKWLLEDAILECKKTLTGNNDEPLEVRIRRMTQAFAKFGVTVEHLETYLGKKVSELLADEIIDLQGIYNALKEGARASDYFGAKEEPQQAAPVEAAETVAKAAAAGVEAKTKAKKVNPIKEAVQAAEQPVSAPVENDHTASAQVSNPVQNDSNSVKAESAPIEPESAPAAAAVQQGVETASNEDDDGDVF